MNWQNSSVLVTGGTGSFGKKFTEMLLKEHGPKKLVIFSRDELKQHEMQQQFPARDGSPLRYFIGDVRDRDRLTRALEGIDIVVHAAAIKQVPTAEYNPFEYIKTNVIGAQNLIESCAAGCPVVLGPHVFNFADAVKLACEAGAAVQTPDTAGAAQTAVELLSDDSRRRAMSESARAFARAHRGASERIADLLKF